MASNTKNSLNLGQGSSKSRLVASLADEYKKLNTVLKETEKLSKSIFDNLKGVSGGGSNNANAMTTMTPPGGSGFYSYGNTPPAPRLERKESTGFREVASAAVTALSQGVDPSNYISNDIMRQRYGFYSGLYSPNNPNIANTSARLASQRMNYQGTAISALDAIQALMAGANNGLGPGLANHRTIETSAASVSNIMPGAGLEVGMGAVAALNQGSSVNKLRMIGINVRDQNGFMRGIEDIARDLWNMLNKTKGGGKTNITERDLAFSLQSGNSLDMLLNQYFSGDPVLRQSVVAYLYQFAKNNGATISGGYTSQAGQAALKRSGALPGISQSMGSRNSAGYDVTDAYTSSGVTGVQMANTVISGLSQISAFLAPIAGPLATATTFSQTIGGAGNGAGGVIMKSLLDITKIAADGMIVTAKAAADVALANPEIAAAIGGGIMLRAWQDRVNDEGIVKSMDKTGAKATSTTGYYDWVNSVLSLGTNIPGGGSTGSGSTGSGSTGSGSTGSSKGGTNNPSSPKIGGTASVQQLAWAKALLIRMGVADANTDINDPRIKAIAAWEVKENTGAANNPLASTHTLTGHTLSKNWNSTGVKNYDSASAGLDATIENLKINGYGYPQLLADLKNKNSDENTIFNDIKKSGWSGTNYTVVNVNLPKEAALDPKTLALEIKRILNDGNTRATAQGVPSTANIGINV